MSQKLTILVPDDLGRSIGDRHRVRHDDRSRSLAARDDLQAFADLLHAELVRQSWSLADLDLIQAALAGRIPRTVSAPGPLGFVYGAVYATHLDDLDPVSGLLARLGRLGPAADLALTDAVAGWLADQDARGDAESWARHGLRVREGTGRPDAGEGLVPVERS